MLNTMFIIIQVNTVINIVVAAFSRQNSIFCSTYKTVVLFKKNYKLTTIEFWYRWIDLGKNNIEE